MKVFEKINQLKGTEATVEQIADWGYMNKICPIEFNSDTLELDCDYPKELNKISQDCCSKFSCSYECMETFLNTEIKEATKNPDQSVQSSTNRL